MAFGRVLGFDTSAMAVEMARAMFGAGASVPARTAARAQRERSGADLCSKTLEIPAAGFAAGTRIATPSGLRAVETLRPGEVIYTLDAGPMALAGVEQARVAAVGEMAPIRIAAGALGADRAIFLAPQQRVLVRDQVLDLLFGEAELLVAAQTLVEGEMVTRSPGGKVRYTRLIFDRPHLVLADGVVSESYQAGWAMSAGSAAVAQVMRKLVA